MASFRKILIVQTAFIGDVVLVTPLLEKLHQHFPDAKLDFLLRKGNEGLLDGHPFLNKVLVWDKKRGKYANLLQLMIKVRRERYDLVVNLQRYFSSGLLMAFAGARTSVCFDKNPLSFLATSCIPHQLEKGKHEVERNLSVIAQWTDNQLIAPKLYPPNSDFQRVHFHGEYLTISPASVWFTKQFPKEKWLAFMDGVGERFTIFLLGGPGDLPLCKWLAAQTKHPKTIVKAGQFSVLESAAFMKNAAMNFVNDSAPLHFASAMDAPVTAVFCSTIPEFGFTPLSSNSSVVETELDLPCRPCGLHGKKACPQGHFRCAEIDIQRLLAKLP